VRSSFLPFLVSASLLAACHESATFTPSSAELGSPAGVEARHAPVIAETAAIAGRTPAPSSTAAAAAPPPDADGATPAAEDEAPDEPGVRGPTAWRGDDSLAGNRRAEAAVVHKQAEVERMFADAGVAFPPKELLWRVFKDKHHLEVWANDTKGAPMKKIATYRACAMSGDLGPKHREGDRQVPEGFYRIEYFFPDSAFHLAAKVSYPNALDRATGDPVPGGDIMIHGGCASIGCIALTDERIEELWVIGSSVIYKGEPIHVHIFPSRDMDALIEDDAWAKNRAFWENLREGFQAFEADKRLPNIRIGFHRKYEVDAT
jgi:hypothetical protein